jgi:hypothetical protein
LKEWKFAGPSDAAGWVLTDKFFAGLPCRVDVAMRAPSVIDSAPVNFDIE